MLLVFGPRSPTYDFGPGHPLTPRRFGPGLDLLRAVGAEPGLAPEPAPDDELEWCHERRYIATVKRFSADPFGFPEAGIGVGGDDPPFAGMHDAAAAVAGGSLRAMEAVLRGDVEHAFHPGGGLHHAMRDHASGFCIYDDPALAIARARRDGLRVLYVDLDVHHGDGVQAIHAADPGVLTVSFHESGRYLFPGTGGVGELGDGVAAGTSVNVPLEPGTGEGAWLAAVRGLLPELAAAFGPDVIVSQHGADSHAWDPLAHLLVTRRPRWARRRDSWTLLRTGSPAAAGWRPGVAATTPIESCRGRGAWSGWPGPTETSRSRRPPRGASAGRPRARGTARRRSPRRSTTPPNAGLAFDGSQASAEARSLETAAVVRRLVVPRLLQVARDRGWWDPMEAGAAGHPVVTTGGDSPTIIADIDAETWDRLWLAAGVVAPADPRAGHALILAAIRDGARVTAAVAKGATVVGVAVAGPHDERGRREVLAVGVATVAPSPWPGRARCWRHAWPMRRSSLPTSPSPSAIPIDPLARDVRSGIARRLLERAGFEIGSPAAADPPRRPGRDRGRADAGRRRSVRANSGTEPPVGGRTG